MKYFEIHLDSFGSKYIAPIKVYTDFCIKISPTEVNIQYGIIIEFPNPIKEIKEY